LEFLGKGFGVTAFPYKRSARFIVPGGILVRLGKLSFLRESLDHARGPELAIDPGIIAPGALRAKVLIIFLAIVCPVPVRMPDTG
jgi:hypothetical protein